MWHYTVDQNTNNYCPKSCSIIASLWKTGVVEYWILKLHKICYLASTTKVSGEETPKPPVTISLLHLHSPATPHPSHTHTHAHIPSFQILETALGVSSLLLHPVNQSFKLLSAFRNHLPHKLKTKTKESKNTHIFLSCKNCLADRILNGEATTVS